VDKFDAKTWTEKIRRYRTPLVVAGQGCREIRLNGRGLGDYALDVAEALACPVAATGNAVRSLGEAGRGVRVKKMWLAELFRYLEEEWQEPLAAGKPDLLLTIGLHPELLEGLAAGLEGVELVHLGPGAVAGACLSVGAVPLDEWAQDLERLVRELARPSVAAG